MKTTAVNEEQGSNRLHRARRVDEATWGSGYVVEQLLAPDLAGNAHWCVVARVPDGTLLPVTNDDGTDYVYASLSAQALAQLIRAVVQA